MPPRPKIPPPLLNTGPRRLCPDCKQQIATLHGRFTQHGLAPSNPVTRALSRSLSLHPEPMGEPFPEPMGEPMGEPVEPEPVEGLSKGRPAGEAGRTVTCPGSGKRVNAANRVAPAAEPLPEPVGETVEPEPVEGKAVESADSKL